VLARTGGPVQEVFNRSYLLYSPGDRGCCSKVDVEGAICDAAHEFLAALHHEEDNQMEHTQYWHFPSWAREGVDVVVLPAEGCDRIGCSSNQVKLTHALNKDLDEAVKEIQ
jgi:hypothetical protein